MWASPVRRSFITNAQSVRTLPLFFAYCPDKANALEKRLEVRPKHWERVNRETKEGLHEFGLGYLPDAAATHSANPAASSTSEATLASPLQPMDGSVLIFRSQTLESAWERIKADVYWTAGVWDPKKAVVKQFINHEKYDDRK